MKLFFVAIALMTLASSAFAAAPVLTSAQKADRLASLQLQVKTNADNCAAISSPTQLQTLTCSAQAAQGALMVYQAQNPVPAPSSSP